MKTLLFSTTLALVAIPSLAAETLDQQVQQVQEAVVAWRLQKQHGPVTMVLGALSQDKARFTKAGPNTLWVYVDFREHKDLGEPHLQLDFNNLGDLGKVAGALKGQMDTVVFDRGVVYFATWTADHLAAMSALLSPRGTFFMPAQTSHATSKHLPAFQTGKDAAADGALLGARSAARLT